MASTGRWPRWPCNRRFEFAVLSSCVSIASQSHYVASAAPQTNTVASSRQSLSLFYFSVSSLPFCAVFVLFFFFHFVRILFLSISLLIISVSPFVLCSGRLRPHLAKHHRRHRHRQLSSWRRMRPPPLRRPRPQRRLSIKSAPLCLCPRNRHRSPPHQLPRSPRSLLSLRLAPVD